MLTELSKIVNFPYRSGDFSVFENMLGKVEDFFVVKTVGLTISVHLEKRERYFFATISGEGETFTKSKKYLMTL